MREEDRGASQEDRAVHTEEETEALLAVDLVERPGQGQSEVELPLEGHQAQPAQSDHRLSPHPADLKQQQ